MEIDIDRQVRVHGNIHRQTGQGIENLQHRQTGQSMGKWTTLTYSLGYREIDIDRQVRVRGN